MNARAELFVDSRCELGEGPFWHPLLKRLFWFDILNSTLLSADEAGNMVDRFTFKDFVSAAGVIDQDRLLIAQAGALLEFSLSGDSSRVIAELEADKPGNRTNDGRVDRTGGLWVGTMSRRGGQDTGAGALYRYRAGTLTTILTEQTIPNSTCFSPDGTIAYFADTMTGTIRKVATDRTTGLPVGEWGHFASAEGRGGPDGAVTDAEGYVWSARWGASCVVRHAPDGSIDRIVDLPVSRVTCPAFGGDDLRTLYITSAREHMTPDELEKEPHAGSVFAIRVDVPGLHETLVAL